MNSFRTATAAALACAALAGPGLAQTSQPVQHVLLLSVDGLHAQDLSRYIAAHPQSALAALSRRGVVYPNAYCARPSDSFPGLLALVTGGTPKSTGVYYDDSYDRLLLPPTDPDQAAGLDTNGPNAQGTEVLYDESIEFDSDRIDGGGGIDPAKLPRDPQLKNPVYPHNFLKVNTIFQVVKNAGLPTAWADKHLAYDLVNGPDSYRQGPNVDDLYTPEIAATKDAAGNWLYPDHASGTANVPDAELNDGFKVQAVLNEIDGKDHSGTRAAAVPAVFGMNFQALSVAQKAATGGYADAGATPTTGPNGTQGALDFVDASLGRFVAELQKQNLTGNTAIILTAKHGQAPIDRTKLVKKKGTPVTTLDPADQIAGLTAHVTEDDVSLAWLKDASTTPQAVNILKANQAADHLQAILYGPALQFLYGDPANASRIPDILGVTVPGTIYTKGAKIAEHGGFGKDDTNVGLLVAAPGLPAGTDPQRVETRQVAPTILRLLGLDPNALQAVQKEGTTVLPNLGL